MSARLEPLLFHKMTRCHSVFSCFSPALFFQCRLVATERVATREPFEVLRTSGSAPRFPIRIALFRLRLTCTSWMLAWGHEIAPPRRAASVPLLQLEPQYQRVLARVAVVRRTLPHGPKAVPDVEG